MSVPSFLYACLFIRLRTSQYYRMRKRARRGFGSGSSSLVPRSSESSQRNDCQHDSWPESAPASHPTCLTACRAYFSFVRRCADVMQIVVVGSGLTHPSRHLPSPTSFPSLSISVRDEGQRSIERYIRRIYMKERTTGRWTRRHRCTHTQT